MTGRPRTAEHGSRTRYVSGCRCGPCKTSNADYQRGWRHTTGRTTPAERHPERHGPYRYRHGCRCEVCRRANADAVARYRDRHPRK